MSLPEFQTGTDLTREEAINQIIASVAMEELALSHIINAEGEKLQYVLGTIPGVTGPAPTIEEVLRVNESVQSVLQSVAETQSVLRSKLQNALNSAVLTGPTGPTGGTGETGAPGEGSILLFSSGTELELPADAAGDPTVPMLIGVGTSTTGTFDGAEIDLTGEPGTAANFAIIVPRDGAVSDIAANFYATAQTQLNGATGTVTAQLYRSIASDDYFFTEIASVTLAPELTSATTANTVLSGSAPAGQDIPVTAGERLLLAFKAHATPSATGVTLTGFGSASISIS